jgi:prepilin-type N-terminal cleavage/methylation domain-containing protein/prepilin-type processing-associated H-X9-DG protein
MRRGQAIPRIMKLRISTHIPRHRGFTLIEVLVVIVIIIALAAVVFPVARGIRQAAGTAKTVSNLRQIQAANVSFASENNGFFLGNAPDGGGPWGPPWFTYMPFVSMLGVNATGEGESGNVLPVGWGKNYPEVLKCGMDVSVSANPDQKDRNFTIAMNWSSFSHQSDGTPGGASWWIGGKTLQSRIKNPSKLIMFHESSEIFSLRWDRLAWKGDDAGFSLGLAFRNKGKTCNVVFADGHVAALTRKDVEKDDANTKRYFDWDAD